MLGRGSQAAACVLVVLAFSGVAIQKTHRIASQVRDAESTHTLRTADGVDFGLSVWVPTHALFKAVDPYDPRSSYVKEHFGGHEPASIYTPAALTILMPLSLAAYPVAVSLMALLNLALLWTALVMIFRPTTIQRALVTVGVGIAITYGYAAEATLLYGQPVGFFVLGTLLLSRSLCDPRANWWSAMAGLCLLSLKVQSALPVLILWALLRRWRPLMAAAAILGALSVPIVVLWARAAGSLGAMFGSTRRNLDFLDAYNSGWGRTDLVTLLTRGHAHTLGTAAELAVMLAIVVLVGLRMRQNDGNPRDAVVAASVIAGMELVSVYHQPYDLLMLAVPVALVVRSFIGYRSSVDVLGCVLITFLVLDLLSRPSLRYKIHDYAVVMNRYWPAVISITVFAAAMAAWSSAPCAPTKIVGEAAATKASR